MGIGSVIIKLTLQYLKIYGLELKLEVIIIHASDHKNKQRLTKTNEGPRYVVPVGIVVGFAE